MLNSTGSTARSFSNFFTYFFDSHSVFVTEKKCVVPFTRPMQTSLLMALPAEILVRLLQHTNELISPLLLSNTCTHFKQIYEDVRFYQAHERQSHVFLYNLTILELQDHFYTMLLDKRHEIVAIPAPHSFKWVQLRDHPLEVKNTARGYHGTFIQKTYITVWNLLLQPTVLNNTPQTIELMGILLALLPHVSNANSYAQHLFEGKVPHALFKHLINIHTDWGLQLLCKHFSAHDIRAFAADISPTLPKIIKAIWPEIRNNPYQSFLQCALTYFAVFFIDEKLKLLLDRLLFTHGADYNLTDKDGNTPLMLACKYRQLALVKLLVQQPYIHLNAINQHKESVLDYAVKYGTVSIVQVLLEHKIKINRYVSAFNYALRFNKIDMLAVLKQKVTTLMGSNAFIHQAVCYAISSGETRVVDKLIKGYGANPNTTNKAGLSILRLALQQQDLLLLDTLLNSEQFTIDIAEEAKGRTAVRYALALRNFPQQWLAQLINHLFVNGKDCNVQNTQGNTPLILACMYNRGALVKLLLQQKNIDLNIINKQGLSALDYAVRYSTAPIIEKLLNHGVNLAQHLKALNYAVKFKKVNTVIALLKVAGFSVFIKQALAYAITAGEAKVAYILIKDYAAPADTVNHVGTSALDLALQKQHTLLLNLLLQLPELELNTNNNALKTALHYALELRLYPSKQLIELVTRLIMQGADCNAVDEAGNTPLMLACKHPQQALALLLLRQSPLKINIQNKAGFSAVDYVVKYGTTTLLQTLLHHKVDRALCINAFNHALRLGKADMVRLLQPYS
jgi:ankyrin repeat protein